MIVLVMGSEKQVKMYVGIYSQHKTSLLPNPRESVVFSGKHHYWLFRISVETST